MKGAPRQFHKKDSKPMKPRLFVLVLLFAASILASKNAIAQVNPSKAVKNVVLVHGAFADGSSWSKVIPLLQAQGLHVVAVHLPFTSFADDVAATKRAIAAEEGPVLLVGHSYGGLVITEAGNDPKVAGLVYVAAFAPNDGEAIADLGKEFPQPPGIGELRPQAAGFLLLTDKGIADDFAQDLSADEKGILVATQPPTPASIFAAKITTAAWRSKPTWYVVAAEDRMISPQLEKGFAKQMNATTTTVPSSHVAMLAFPKEVAGVIEQAAAGSSKQDK
jgi:pimeloyl-ACP methyl ester carboxylesterase